MPSKGYFQPQQAREVAKAFAKHKIDYIFIGKSGAILLGYPFDLDLVFAPDGIESLEKAEKRMVIVENFHIANLLDIIASKRAAGREKDLADLPLLEDFRIEYEKANRKEPRTALEIALDKTDKEKKKK